MRLLLLTAAIFCSSFAFGQSSKMLWTDVETSSIDAAKFSEGETLPVQFRSMSLDLAGMKTYLENAPKETDPNRKEHLLNIDIPLPSGKYETFQIWETTMMQSGIAARYPHIRSFMGTNPETGSMVMMDYGVQGFHASVRAVGATYFIDPLSENTDDLYISYDLKDDLDFVGFADDLTCGHESHDIQNLLQGSTERTVANRGVGEPAVQRLSLIHI